MPKDCDKKVLVEVLICPAHGVTALAINHNITTSSKCCVLWDVQDSFVVTAENVKNALKDKVSQKDITFSTKAAAERKCGSKTKKKRG